MSTLEETEKIEAVTERDIDLLLLEELNVNPAFSSWFLEMVTGAPARALCVGAWHSLTDGPLGESDLVVLYDDGLALLVENKISAAAQPEQGARYRSRGDRGIEKGYWKRFVTCIVAPEMYLEVHHEAEIYDSVLNYESVAEWFLSGDVRSKYKGKIITDAIEQNRRGYTVDPDERVTDFWTAYWAYSMKHFPELEMKKPGPKPANSDWPGFRPLVLAKGYSVVHKLERGHVDLQISGATDRTDEIAEILSGHEVEVVKAGKSAAVRLTAPKVDRFGTLHDQEMKVRAGLDCVRALLEIAQYLQSRFRNTGDTGEFLGKEDTL